MLNQDSSSTVTHSASAIQGKNVIWFNGKRIPPTHPYTTRYPFIPKQPRNSISTVQKLKEKYD